MTIALLFQFGIVFMEADKSDGIKIYEKGRIIKSIDNMMNQCILNLKMEKGTYHIKYKNRHEKESDNIVLGFSTSNTSLESKTCSFYANNGGIVNISGDIFARKVIDEISIVSKEEDESIYEIIVDMNIRELWMSNNNLFPVLLVKDLPSPLYPYVGLNSPKASVEILSVSYQEPKNED